ncbi:hypothetical protein ACOX9X_07895 [Photobacterium leiognathi subsp. mandapamensis]|uniref:hypothetical protein n=1 Tax=Photobacterium leiognathi TaxID=553611 RepID=UPI003BF58616
MNKVVSVSFILAFSITLSGCNGKQDITTGVACLGSNNHSLIEGLPNQCKKGDIIATKKPAYFCDFNYTVAYNDYNSAYCVYSGKQKDERITLKPETNT